MKKIILAVLAAGLVFLACTKENSTEDKLSDGFDRKKMLIFWADKVIKPAYEDFAVKTDALNSTITSFNKNKNEVNLNKAREAFREAYIVWQKVSLFQIGKAAEIKAYGLKSRVNTFPTNTSEIQQYSELANVNFENGSTVTVQGLPALDYLLYGVDGKTTDAEIVAFYTANAGYSKFLTLVSAELNNLAISVRDSWTSSFRDSFVKSSANTATSSTNVVVNYFVVKFFEEQLRKYKIDVPSGVASSSLEAEKVEGYYSKTLSKELFITAIKASQDFINGKSYDGTKVGISLKQYLKYLNKSNLAKSLDDKFNDLLDYAKVNLEDNFAAQILEQDGFAPDKKDFFIVYNKLQLLVAAFKTDMMKSAMKIPTTSVVEGDDD